MPDTLLLPDPHSLSEFTQNFTREGRSEDGSMSYLPSTERLKIIKDCILVDLATIPARPRSVAEIFGI